MALSGNGEWAKRHANCISGNPFIAYENTAMSVADWTTVGCMVRKICFPACQLSSPFWVKVIRLSSKKRARLFAYHHIIFNRHPFKADAPLNGNLVSERPSVSFLWGGSSKYLQNVSLHVQGTPQKNLEKCSFILGTSSSSSLKPDWLYLHMY